jgi:DNA-binding transcriptional LysR family regulator
MSGLNLNHLAIFDAVATEKNISRGAAKLMISQPAVSKQLAQFEHALGVTLVERLPRGVRLTQEGELLARYARQIFNLRDETALALAGFRGLTRGTLRIGASTTIATYLLPQLIVRFKRKYPMVSTALEVTPSASVQRRLLDGEIDLGFVELFDENDALDAKVIYHDELVAIGSYRHPLARKRGVTLEHLAREPFVLRDTGSDTKSFVVRVLAQKGVTLSPVMSLGSTEAIKRAVSAGIGVAIVSRLSIDLELRTRRLSVLPVRGLSIKRPFYRLLRSGRRASPASQAFLNLAQARQADRETGRQGE